ncbi:MAG TPA: condensation domain-containing protein, partial [Terrimicrobiaceae bacterium]
MNSHSASHTLREERLAPVKELLGQESVQATNSAMSFAQERLWFLEQLGLNGAVYNVPFAYRVIGELDLQALERSFREIIRRHESLRTTFTIIDGKPRQVISSDAPFAFEVIDLRQLPLHLRSLEAERQAAQEAKGSFDLGRGPLLRARIVRLDEREHLMLMCVHHIAYDAWSHRVLMTELAELYEAFAAGERSSLPEPPAQYKDFARSQRACLKAENFDKQLAYWRKQLSGSPATLELPSDRPRPAVQTFRGERHDFLLSRDLSKELKDLSRREGVTLFVTLLGAFQTLMYRYTRQEDIVIGSPVAQRNRREIENSIGLFVNTLALRTDLRGCPSFRELLKRVREVVMGALMHQDMPFEKLVESLKPRRDVSRHPFIDVLFVLHSARPDTVNFGGLRLEQVPINSGTAKFDLTVALTDLSDGSLSVEMEYSSDLFEASTIERMCRHFETLLEAIVKDPSARISDLPLLREGERKGLLENFNDTQRVLPKEKIPELFERQVKKAPEATALVIGERCITYQELNARANRLAHHLITLGIG